MNLPFPLRLLTFGLPALIVISAATAFAAGITISPTSVGSSSADTIDKLRGDDCIFGGPGADTFTLSEGEIQ